MKTRPWLARGALAAAFCAILVACGSDGRDRTTDPAIADASTPPGPTTAPLQDPLYVQLGDDLAGAVKARVKAHLTKRSSVIDLPADYDVKKLSKGDRVLAIGETSAARALIPDSETSALRAEGYVLKSAPLGEARALAVRGSKASSPKLPKLGDGTIATAFGAYAALEELGFGFLHPLAPTTPTTLTALAPAARREEPRWPIRGLQLHTMHPLELTNVLQGWGVTGPEDGAGFEGMLPEWDTFLEWMVANGQNRVHWIILEADGWKEFATSATRQARLKELVKRAHAFGVMTGVDVPIVQRQQNTFRLIRTISGDLAGELAELKSRIDYLLAAGFDYVSTSNGTTEFTHTDATRMLAWMDGLAAHVAERHGGKPTYMKAHASTGQTAPDFIDPSTGQPINYNYLPHFADARMGVMPHTVQHYGLDDPAPTYGNTDFGYVRDFLRREVGRREVIWHPETAYWVSFDVDVPLFLPVYAERRVHDLRLLGGDEEAGRMGVGVHAGKHMDGQLTFSSGWEWGYWLNDVVTARAAWNPHLEAKTDDAALATILDGALRPFGDARGAVRDLVIETARVERELLIEGRISGQGPASTIRKNGQAYLQGFDTWDDVSDLGSRIPGLGPVHMTQPARVGLTEMRLPIRPAPRYTGEVEPLLAQMKTRFAALYAKWSAVRSTVPPAARDLYDDLVDAMHVTWARARQVHGLYDYVDDRDSPAPAPRLARLAEARAALDDAAQVVKSREPRYRVPAERIAGWGTNPTAYGFGYLWTARSLYYFWRDEGLAVDAPSSPCYLNILSMTDVGLGEGTYGGATSMLRTWLDNPASGGGGAECLAAPTKAPSFPQYNLRTRP